ncbi:MAG: hypothetical protein M3Y05_08930 [Gemmatimonadota bacterium]|nr:hypothetical protein [Gemmatimonadota bacterium]
MTAVLRVISIVAATLYMAAVPIYPGATFDVAASKETTARTPKFPVKVYGTPDAYENVVAFYKKNGFKESTGIGVGNDAKQKMGMYSQGDSIVALNFPADVKDKSGKVISHTGTRIAIGS